MNSGVATSNFPDNNQSTPLMTVIEENQASIFAAEENQDSIFAAATSKPVIEPAGINYNNNFEKKENGNLSSMDYQIEAENPFKQQQEAAFSFSPDQGTVKPNPQYSPKAEATNLHKSSSSSEELKHQDQGFAGSEQSGRENNQQYLQDKSFPVSCLQDQYSTSSQPNYKTSEGFTGNSYSNKMFNSTDDYPNQQQIFTSSASTDSLFKPEEENFTSTPVNELYSVPAVKNQLFNATGHVEQIYKTPTKQLYTSSTSSDQVYKTQEPATSVDQYTSSKPVYKSPPPAKQYYSNHSPTEQIFNSPAPTEQIYSSPAEAAYPSPAPAEQIYAPQAPMDKKYPSAAPTDHVLSNPVPNEQSYSSVVVSEHVYPSQTSSEQIFKSQNPAEQIYNAQMKPGQTYDPPATAEQSYSSPTAAEHVYQSPAQVEQIYNASGAGEQIFKSSTAPSEQIFTSSVTQSISAPAKQFPVPESGERYAANNGSLAQFVVPAQEQYNLQTDQQYPSKQIQDTFNNLSAQGQFAAFMNEKQYAATETAEQNTIADVQKQFSSNPTSDQYTGTDKYASTEQFKPVEQYSATSVEQMASKETFRNGSALVEQFSSQQEFHGLQEQQPIAVDKAGFSEAQNQCNTFQPSKMDTFESNLNSIDMVKPAAVVAMDYEITPSSFSKTGTEESRLAMYDDACSAPIQGDPLLSETSVVIDVQKDIENACVENQHGSGILDQSWNTAGTSDLQDWSLGK